MFLYEIYTNLYSKLNDIKGAFVMFKKIKIKNILNNFYER